MKVNVYFKDGSEKVYKNVLFMDTGMVNDFEDLLPKEDLETVRAIMWSSFVCGVVIPFCIMWLICDKLLPFF